MRHILFDLYFIFIMLVENVNIYFVGEFIHTIDDKNRIRLPAKFKNILDKYEITELTITAALPSEKCLLAFPKRFFENYVRSQTSDDRGPNDSKTLKRLKRWLNSQALHVKLASNGRIVLPQKLLEEKGIKKEVYLSGNEESIEIWDKEAYERYKEESREALSNF